MKSSKHQKTGKILFWNPNNQPELQIGHVASQMAWQRGGHVGLKLVLEGYSSPWVNELYNDNEQRFNINLYAYSIAGREDDFTYVAWRVPGAALGEITAAAGQAEEWFEISVTRSRDAEGGATDAVATWRRVEPPAP